MTHDRAICSACGATEFARIADLGSASILRCRNCDLVINRIEVRGAASEYYGEEYDGFYENYYRIFRQRQFKEVFRRLEGVDFPSKRVLDIGCSYGWFLEAAIANGFEAVGVEPSAKAFERLNASKAMDVHNCGVEGVPQIGGRFGFVTMWNVFEHLEDPDAALGIVRSKLEERGVVLLCVPDFSGLITKFSFLAHAATFGTLKSHLLNLYQMDNDFPHLFHYSRKSLEMILRNNGFEPFLAWGQDIVDEGNLGERIRGYAGLRTPLKYTLVTALATVQKVARLAQMQDELVVLARKA